MLGIFYKNAVNKDDAIPAADASIQTFDNFLGFNPHLHILTSDGCFGDSDMFYVSPVNIDAYKLEPLFRHKLLSVLKRKELITDRTLEFIAFIRTCF